MEERSIYSQNRRRGGVVRMRERELADDAAKEGDWVRKKRERGISDGNFGANPDRLIRI